MSRKTKKKNLFFVGSLKVNDENSRIRIKDPFVRIMNPRIRTKAKGPGIRNTVLIISLQVKEEKKYLFWGVCSCWRRRQVWT